MKKTLIAALIGVTTIGGVAVAQQATTTAASAAKPMRSDTNGDGNLTRQEMIAAAEARFARMDANKDGTVTREERRAAREEMRGERGGRGGRHGMRGHGGRGGFGGPMAMERLDTDKDGKLSRAEAAVPMQRMFDRIDTNKDGFIEKAEADAARAKWQQMRQMRRGGPDAQPTPGA